MVIHASLPKLLEVDPSLIDLNSNRFNVGFGPDSLVDRMHLQIFYRIFW